LSEIKKTQSFLYLALFPKQSYKVLNIAAELKRKEATDSQICSKRICNILIRLLLIRPSRKRKVLRRDLKESREVVCLSALGKEFNKEEALME